MKPQFGTLVVVLCALGSSLLVTRASQAGNLIEIPVRWCVCRGTQALANPGGVGETNFSDVLWRRHERASDQVWIPGAGITFRSGITRAVATGTGFPTIDDPNPPASGGPGSEGTSSTPRSPHQLNNLITTCPRLGMRSPGQPDHTRGAACDQHPPLHRSDGTDQLAGWGGFTSYNFAPASANICTTPTALSAARGGSAT